MNKFLITYDLKNKPTKNYNSLFSAIKSIGPWAHYLDSTWMIKTSLNASQIWNILNTHILASDYLLIIKIDANEKWGWLPKDAWNWLNS